MRECGNTPSQRTWPVCRLPAGHSDGHESASYTWEKDTIYDPGPHAPLLKTIAEQQEWDRAQSADNKYSVKLESE